MKNENCYMIKDLLPSYIDEICSEETKKTIEDHLKDCEDCRKAYESMKGTIAGEETDTNSEEYDKSIMEKVSRDVKRKNSRSTVVFGVIIAAVILLFIFINLPIVPLSSRDLYVTMDKPALMLDEAGVRYHNVPENSVLIYDELKGRDLDEELFHKVIFKDGTMQKSDVIYYATEDVNLRDFSIVEIESDKPIRRYKTKTVDYTGEEIMAVYGVKTSILGSLTGKNAVSKSKVSLVDSEGISGVYFKKGKNYQKIDQ